MKKMHIFIALLLYYEIIDHYNLNMSLHCRRDTFVPFEMDKCKITRNLGHTKGGKINTKKYPPD